MILSRAKVLLHNGAKTGTKWALLACLFASIGAKAEEVETVANEEVAVDHAQEEKQQVLIGESLYGASEHFDGITPLSPSVWNTYNVEPVVDSDLAKYLFRDAYLADADRKLLKTESRMFTVPLDDLASTQRRTLSPFMREEEEIARRNYAESVSQIAISKGAPEYLLQLLGLQKLREGVKKIEKAVSLDITVSTPKVITKQTRPWHFRGIFLPYQRSYRTGFTNSIWIMDVQGGWTKSRGDQLYLEVAARWSKYFQGNTYQIFTRTFTTSFAYFINSDFSISASISKDTRKSFKDMKSTTEAVGVSYVF